jgi:hypothetical protein
MIKRKQNAKIINDQKETEHKDSMIKRKENKKTINDQKEREQKDYQ